MLEELFESYRFPPGLRKRISSWVCLRRKLQSLQPGQVGGGDQSEIGRLLAEVWGDLAGSDQGGMVGSKLEGRTENMSWQPPHVCFDIERHGPTVHGSTRAKVQRWKVNVDTGEAMLERQPSRQKYPRAAGVRIRPLAKEVADAIVGDQDHPAVTRLGQDRVRVQFTEIESLLEPSQRSRSIMTQEDRRRRFYWALTKLLKEQGWEVESTAGGYIFRPALTQREPNGPAAPGRVLFAQGFTAAQPLW